jgi:hypothetical protein
MQSDKKESLNIDQKQFPINLRQRPITFRLNTTFLKEGRFSVGEICLDNISFPKLPCHKYGLP